MPLRFRLALWYGSLTTIVVALVCGYSYAIHSRTHYDELDRVLVSVVKHVTEELVAAPDNRDGILNSSLLLGAGVRLLSADGRILAQSRSGAEAPMVDIPRLLASPPLQPYSPLAGLAPALHVPVGASGRFGLVANADGDRMRVYTEPSADKGGAYLVATMPLSHIDRAVERFAVLMVLMAAAAGVLAFTVGWAVARRALHPVATLTEAAATIAESREFSRRVTEGSARDELGHLARTFNTMLASLEGAYDTQVRFVAAASHELRAPLTVVQANLDIVRSGRAAGAERMTALAEASVETERMTRLVADLLVLARADAGVPIRRAPVELDRVVLEVLGEARHIARGQRLEVSGIVPSVVRGDRDRLKQLFLNVIENAIKYTPPTGHVVVTIASEANTAVVTVRDNGVGIAEADLPHVFERFYRADPARSRDPGGSGLGLTIAQWVATQHNGSVAIASGRNDGTTVTVRLPVAAADS